MDNKLSIGDAGSLLIGAGLTKLDDIVLALTLIGVGVLLKVGVAWLQKQGIDVKTDVNNG
jgi:hypothetical protein